MKNSPRVFSLDEANALLPELESLLTDLLKQKEKHARSHDELLIHELVTQAETHSGARVPLEEFEQAARTLEGDLAGIEQIIQRISQLGCILRNAENGWIDFLGERDGERVYFCWKKGEKTIQYYHPFKDDMTARFPLKVVRLHA